MALVCFGLLLQVVSLICLYAQENLSLYKANQQSIFDLSCYSQMRGLMQHNTEIRLCQYNQDDLVLTKMMQIQGVDVTFTDYETYVDATFYKGSRTIHYKLYYDFKGVKGLDVFTE